MGGFRGGRGRVSYHPSRQSGQTGNTVMSMPSAHIRLFWYSLAGNLLVNSVGWAVAGGGEEGGGG